MLPVGIRSIAQIVRLRADHIVEMIFGRVKQVTDLSVTASDESSITVQFTEVDDGAGGLVGYEVYVREVGQRAFILQAEAAGATVGATKSIKAELLDPGTTYEIMVRAILAVAIRAFQSNIVKQATSSSSPGQPTGLGTTSVALGQVNLSWTDNGGTGFSVERRTPPGDSQDPLAGGTWAEIATTADNVNTYNDVFAFVVGTSYEWRVFATDGASTSAPSNTISATIVEEEPTAPGTVTISLSGANPNSIVLSFAASVDDGTGNPADLAIRFWKSSATNPSWGFQFASEHVLDLSGTTIGEGGSFTGALGLATSTEYQFQVVAFRGTVGVDAVFGALSNIVTVSTTAGTSPPADPSGLSVAVDSTQQVTLSWTDNASDETSQSIEERNETDGGSFAEIENVAAGIVTKIHDRGSAYPLGKRFQAQVIAEKTGSDDSGPSNTVLYIPNPASTSGDKFPNEPSGFTAIFEHDLEAIPDGTNGILGNWRSTVVQNLSIVADSDAPFGPNVLDFKYRNGLRAGDSPAKFFILGDFANSWEEFYCSMHMKYVGSDWESAPAGAKFWYAVTGDTNPRFHLFLRTISTAANALDPDYRMRMHWQTPGTISNDQNNFSGSGRPLTVGSYHQIEVHAKHSALDGSDGTLKVWVDNVITINATGIETRNTNESGADGGFVDWEFVPVWGGTGAFRTREDHLRVDHVYASGKTII